MPLLQEPCAIAGLGMTGCTRQYTDTAYVLAAKAVRLALDDAGLTKDDVDGLLINSDPFSAPSSTVTLDLQTFLGLRNLRFLNQPEGYGSTAVQLLQFAAFAIQSGMANVIACIFADTPVIPNRSFGGHLGQPTGIPSLTPAYGLFGAAAQYALAARRHMALYGTTSDHLGAVAIANRSWAVMNPWAMFREPLTLEEYHASRWIAEPFHLLDCTMPVNGAVAVVMTSGLRARELRKPPVYMLGMGQGHPGNPYRAGFDNEVNTGAALARDTAFRMAGVSARDIDACEFYDPFTYVTIVTLEDYGFCQKGEGGPFVAAGNTAPGGSLPTNTGGGQVSGYYLQGMTPLSEAIMQARGEAGERQIPKRDAILVTGSGGFLDYHSCAILSPHPSSS